MEIPIYRRQQTIPATTGGVAISPEKVKEPYLAEANLNLAEAKQGEAISKMGFEATNQLGQFERMMKVAQDAHDTAMVKSALIKSDIEIEKQFRDNPDYQNFEGQLSEIQSRNLENFAGLIRNPRLYEKLIPEIEQHQATQAIKVRGMARKQQVVDIETNYVGNVIPQFKQAILDAPDETTREDYRQQFAELTNGYIRGSVMTADQGFKHIKELTMGTDITRMRQDIKTNPVAWSTLSEQELRTRYPYLSEDHFMKGMEYAEKVENSQNRAAALELKATHDDNAKEAFDRAQLWHKGKKMKDGVPFEEWLEDSRAKDLISEKTYEMYTNKIEKQKDRAVLQSDKWTVSKRIQFGKNKQAFLQDPDASWDDIPKLVSGMPTSAADELSDI